MTGNWEEYDNAWIERIISRLPTGRWVIMVPCREIGSGLHGEFLGEALLKEETWNSNLQSRGKITADYNYCKHRLIDPRLFDTNDQLSKWILELANNWLRVP
jgi:hypothetical protein